MNMNNNPLWQRAVRLTVGGLLGLTLNAAEKAAWLGVAVGPVADPVRHQLKLPRGAGLTVENVADESPAAKAGLERHDVLQKLDDQWLFNADQLTRLVRSYRAGDTLELTVLRGGRPRSLSASLVEHEVPSEVGWSFGGPNAFGGMVGSGGLGGMSGMGGGGLGGGFAGGAAWQPRMEELLKGLNAPSQGGGFSTGWASPKQPTAFLGVVTKAPDETVLEQLERQRAEGGVLIDKVIADSPAAKAGLQQHDLIIELDGKGVADPRQFSDIIGRWNPGDRVTLKMLREGEAKEVQVELGKREPADAGQLEQLQQQYMVAPKIEVHPLPNQPGSVIIMKDPTRPVGPFGGGSAGFGTGSSFGGTAAGGPPYNVEVRATVQGTEHGTKALQTRVGTVVSRDQAGEITVRQENDNRHVTVKDAAGKVLFEGDVNSDADREKLPEEIRERLEKVDGLLQQNLHQPEGPAVQRQLRVLEKGSGPGFIRHEEQEVLMPDAATGV